MTIPTSPAGLRVLLAEDVRDMSGETVMGMRVAAWMWEETEPLSQTKIDRIAFHWSTGPKTAERLFREADVRALVNNAEQLIGAAERVEAIDNGSSRDHAPSTGSALERVDLDEGKARRGQLDDLAIGGDLIQMLRLERMAGNHFWGYVYFRDGRGLRLEFHTPAGRNLEANVEWERASLLSSAEPVRGKVPGMDQKGQPNG